MIKWTFAEFVDDLKTLLEANTDITGLTNPVVRIRRSIPSAVENVADYIALGVDATDVKEQAFLGGNTHNEENQIGCIVQAVRYGSGDSEAVAARDRVVTLVAEIDETLRTNAPKVGDQTIKMKVANRDYVSFPGKVQASNVRVARILFDVQYEARTSP